MNIYQPFSNMGVYETPYLAGSACVWSGFLVIKLKKIMHESNTVSIIFEKVSAIDSAIKRVIKLHALNIHLSTHKGIS